MIVLKITSKLIIFLCLFFFAPLISNAQIKGKTADEKQKNADKKKEELKQEELDAIERGKKRHEKLQEKKIRKRMKKSKKRADRVNANKKPPIWERIAMRFRKKKR